MNALPPKIEARHLRLRAVVYVRQSTPRQVQANPESTRRQYGLAERARRMGWAAAQIEVIDEDLGLSGASSHGRTGFQRLVAAIGLGEVGIVLVTEVSWPRRGSPARPRRSRTSSRDPLGEKSRGLAQDQRL